MARYCIRDLDVYTMIGVHGFERHAPQLIRLTISFDADAAAAAASDRLSDAVDYEALADRVRAHASSSDCVLVERLGQQVLDLVMAEPGVSNVVVRLSKPGALPHAVTIELELRAT